MYSILHQNIDFQAGSLGHAFKVEDKAARENCKNPHDQRHEGHKKALDDPIGQSKGHKVWREKPKLSWQMESYIQGRELLLGEP